MFKFPPEFDSDNFVNSVFIIVPNPSTSPGRRARAGRRAATSCLLYTSKITPLLLGGKQEQGIRAGTENVATILALLAALEVREKQIANGQHLLRVVWRDNFERQLLKELPGATIVGAKSPRLWNTVSALMPDGVQSRWLTKLDKAGFAVSTGSACTTGKEEPSHVLAAVSYTHLVTDQLAGEDYYRLRQFSRRPDCIYKNVNGKAELKKSAKFHTNSDHRKRDVGLKFENAFVLLSRDFRYFGKRGATDYKNNCPNLKKLIEGLKQGHRNHLNPELRNELLGLKDKMWKKNKRMKIGIPTDVNLKLSCNADCPSASC